MDNLKSFLRTTTGKIIFTVVIYVIYFGLMSLIGAVVGVMTGGVAEIIAMVIAWVCCVAWVYCGWKSLTVIQPRIFLIMPIVGWLIYFGIKGFVSLILGIFVLPYRLSKFILKRI